MRISVEAGGGDSLSTPTNENAALYGNPSRSERNLGSSERLRIIRPGEVTHESAQATAVRAPRACAWK
jgi:hypothetical protein